MLNAKPLSTSLYSKIMTESFVLHMCAFQKN